MEADDSGGVSDALRGMRDGVPAGESPLDRAIARARLFPGTEPPTIAGRYEIERRLGSGGMGVVYAARDRVLERRLAIKVLASEIGEDARWRARLLREARALAELSHPNVVTVYDAGEWQGAVYIAMELLEGQSLASWLEREPHSCRLILEVYLDAAAGLVAAHERGIVHRDFKPHNVWVEPGGRVRVLDFGLARWRREERTAPAGMYEPDAHAPAASVGPCGGSHDSQRVASWLLVGTPAYMSPEQLHGFDVDERSDQYSFCVALFEATQGHHPTQPAATPRRERLARALLPLLRRGLSTVPAERFATLGELGEALSSLLGRRSRWLRRGSLAVVAGSALVAVSLGFHSRALTARVEESAASARDRARLSAATRPDLDATTALALLGEVEQPERLSGFRSTAMQALQQPHARWVVSSAEHFVAARATAIAPTGACAALAGGNQLLLWFRDRPDTSQTLEFGAVDLQLSSDCSWLGAKRREGLWTVLRVAPSATAEARPSPLDTFEVSAAGLDFSRDSQRLCAAVDGAFELIDLGSRRREQRLEHPGNRIWTAHFSADGRALLGIELGGGALLRWLLAGAAPAKAEPLCERSPWGALEQFGQSPDGRWFAGAFHDGTVRLWPSDRRCEQATAVLRHQRRVTALSFDASGRWLASGSLDDSVGLWSMQTQTARRFGGHEEGVTALDFSPDGRFLLSAAADATVRAWRSNARVSRWSCAAMRAASSAWPLAPRAW